MKMSKTRIFVEKKISLNLLLYIKGKQLHFLKNVIRVKINDQIDVFDGITGEWTTKVLSINRDSIVLKIINLNKKITENYDVWLLFAPIKSHRMGIAVQKATELGVTRIIPCITEFTNSKKINLKNLNDNAIEASEQSKRMDVPQIDKGINLKEILQNWPKDRKLIFCDEKFNDKTIFDTLFELKVSVKKIALLIGPEGGFSDIERDIIKKNENVLSVSLGNKVLRSDTAITVALFSIQQILS
ncbi:MAG: 16S rRNA (uracil(1498)-N(3))-methyltransferase [Rickettsiales bacterium]|nr:16S rRNA (uracil(1498)-N(3))-methyltransferase [Rickettsiales bacterium]|tara:strand:- start:2415 stop:3143 length:729 start_codon:yes stop_codon:yes gene_type:complete